MIGPFGFGWSLGIPAITRKTDQGIPRYLDHDESDVFILSGAEDLQRAAIKVGDEWVRENPVLRMVAGVFYRIDRYRPRIEGLFARIELWTDIQTNVTYWRSISAGNVTTVYGRDGQSRIADPADPSRIFSWLICEMSDDRGNAAVYEYVHEDSSGVGLSQTNEQQRTPASRDGGQGVRIRGRHTWLRESDCRRHEGRRRVEGRDHQVLRNPLVSGGPAKVLSIPSYTLLV